ncbi:very short patch repair protein [Ferrovum sp. JA12]|uniref:very short patch repair endonuclease n=1 Tax=Ferrovum sp. JA12 TaxID=1356299 RepID=UPI0007037307|nr:DNA mismatch endonuclease Vsr [Ferrovum sp. JA12]KRH78319.1 very short patch repair protein [Ferrovum sp. JA12]
MTDIVDSKTRSRMMSGIKSKDTAPEMVVRRFLHRAGLRYRLHDYTLPGCPDLVLPRYRTVIFVNGCFWHRHPGCKLAYSPKNNFEIWQKKFDRNVLRDQRNIETLIKSGWRVIVVWECGLRKNPYNVLIALVDEVRCKHTQSMVQISSS